MLYDVTINRVATAQKVIRVEADDPGGAEDKAVEQAHDEDFAGCVTDYDFECASVQPVVDQGAPLNPLQDAVQRSTKEGSYRCDLCGRESPADFDKVAEEGWYPNFFEGEEQTGGPVCPHCLKRFCYADENGEEVLKGFRAEFVSRWDTGHEFRSACVVNVGTGMVEIVSAHDTDESVGNLVEEFVVLDSRKYRVAHQSRRSEFSPEQRACMFFYQ
jgi:hypothetical protein